MPIATSGPQASLPDLIGRLRAGHKADDVPCLMAAFGCNYDEACELVFTGRHPEAITLLTRTVTLWQAAGIA